MKRSLLSGTDSDHLSGKNSDYLSGKNSDYLSGDDRKMKKLKSDLESAEDKIESVLLDENLLYEVLKHADARTLGVAACVNTQWHKTSKDERLWELICTKQWANIGCGKQQLRSVVLALGGFRRLHALYLWPLAKPAVVAPETTSAWPCIPVAKAGTSAAPAKTRWGKDEVHLSLSLLSIRYYEKMNFSSRGK
ncbi:F-box protein GID2-like [Apium graveolens]|uniref:F-box protein GID2-like n=1 Tax=Apium graveolens TaxID=4045 RepID=UPI003D7AD556